MARRLGMSAPAFAQGAKKGRFTTHSFNEKGQRLFDPNVVQQEYDRTKDYAQYQNRAAGLPKERQGGRPRKNPIENTEPILKPPKSIEPPKVKSNPVKEKSEKPINQKDIQILNQAMQKQENDQYSNSLLKTKLTKELTSIKHTNIKIKQLEGDLVYRADERKAGAEGGSIIISFIDTYPIRNSANILALVKSGGDIHALQEYLRQSFNNLIIDIRRYFNVDIQETTTISEMEIEDEIEPLEEIDDESE